jgi:PAS domain S-box-containing protein
MRSGHPVLAAVFAGLALGAVLGAAATRGDVREFAAGVLILLPLSMVVVILSRVVRTTDKRLIAGEANYRSLFDHAIEGIFRTTSDGHYLNANQALADIYGYASPATLMSGLTDIASQLYVDPDRRSRFRQLLQADDKVADFVSEIRRQDGKTIWIRENARAVRDWTGRVVCYEGTVEDVTAKLEAEREMRDALRTAEEAGRAQSAFLAAMSHELKTPLNAVIGFSEILKEEAFGPIGQDAYRGYAANIHESGHRLLSLINDILDASRLAGGAITVHAKPTHLAQVVGNAIAMAQTATKDSRRIGVELPRNLPEVNVDGGRLSQALSNLIANALKFTPAAGTVRVSAGRSADGGIAIVVSDTGIGMAAEQISAALESFRQLDHSLSRRFEGAGLGLSIAKSLVELHGGSLLVESGVGLGTQVTVCLPAVRLCQWAQRAD